MRGGRADELVASHPAFGAGVEAPWLRDVRTAALRRFEQLGMPGSHLEAWKYTSTRTLQEPSFRHADAVALDGVEAIVAPHRLAHAVAELVFVDGRLVPSLSRLPALDGVTIVGLADTLRDRPEALADRLGRLVAWQDEAFSALNVAFLQDGLWLVVDRGVAVAGPVHVVEVGTPVGGPVVAHLRHLVDVGEGALVTVVETLLGQAGEPVLANVVVEAHVGANAALTHVVAGLGADTCHTVHTFEGRLARDARLSTHFSWIGGAITRSNVHVVHAGPGATATVDGLYVLGGRQHVDNHTVVDHASPHGTTRETYKGVLGGRSRGVFDGLVVVRAGARQTDSVQECRNLLVSTEADASAKPTLEIYDDDVKCGHGTTVGQLDGTQLGYLRSRGIPVDLARQMLTAAFVADLVDRLVDPVLRERLRELVARRLEWLQEVG